jgi:tetratricopeptide (TPR) repeat protein
MQSRQLSQTGSVSENTALDLDVKVDDIGIIAQSIRSFLRAQVAFQNEDINTINEEIDWLSKNIYIASQSVEGGGIAMCAAGTTRYAPTENSVKIAQVMKNQIQALAALNKGDDQLFEVHMKNAVKLEEDTNFPAGPPSITQPSYEQYGEWLLKKGKYSEASELFDKALSRMPRRSKSLVGRMTAMKKLNQVNEVKLIKGELSSIFSQADDGVKALLN